MSTPDLPDFCIQHTQTIAELKADVEALKGAFPDGPVNHRRAHEEMISAAMSDKNFMREMKLDMAKKGTFLFVMFILGLLWMGLELKIKAIFGIGGH